MQFNLRLRTSKLFLLKNIKFPVPTEFQRELQVHHRLPHLLLPVEYSRLLTENTANNGFRKSKDSLRTDLKTSRTSPSVNLNGDEIIDKLLKNNAREVEENRDNFVAHSRHGIMPVNHEHNKNAKCNDSQNNIETNSISCSLYPSYMQKSCIKTNTSNIS